MALLLATTNERQEEVGNKKKLIPHITGITVRLTGNDRILKFSACDFVEICTLHTHSYTAHRYVYTYHLPDQPTRTGHQPRTKREGRREEEGEKHINPI